jgi:acyl carrier protein
MMQPGTWQEEGTQVIAEQIRVIWERELALDRISDDEDFFTLGGHSLIMQRIQGAIKDKLDVEVPMDELFTHSTIKDISAYIASMPPVLRS